MKTHSLDETKALGARLAGLLGPGDVVELVGDIGAGKTTLVKGMAEALGVAEPVQSPTFTISRTYQLAGGLRLAHYDFYRLVDAGVMADELAEAVADHGTLVVVEWADSVADVLPTNRVTLTIRQVADDPDARIIDWTTSGEMATRLAELTV